MSTDKEMLELRRSTINEAWPYWVIDYNHPIPRVACLCVDLPMAKRIQAMWPDTKIVHITEIPS